MTVPERDKAPPTAQNPHPDAPLRLSEAAKIVFGSAMTASGLRREAARGRLEIERIAGKDFTTLRAIEEMRERCRLTPKAPASISAATPRPGPSEMATSELAHAAAAISVNRLRGVSPTISPPNAARGKRRGVLGQA